MVALRQGALHADRAIRTGHIVGINQGAAPTAAEALPVVVSRHIMAAGGVGNLGAEVLRARSYTAVTPRAKHVGMAAVRMKRLLALRANLRLHLRLALSTDVRLALRVGISGCARAGGGLSRTLAEARRRAEKRHGSEHFRLLIVKMSVKYGDNPAVVRVV